VSHHWYWRVAQSIAVSLELLAAYHVVLAAPSHVSTILARVSGDIHEVVDVTAGGIQWKTDPQQFLLKKTLIHK